MGLVLVGMASVKDPGPALLLALLLGQMSRERKGKWTHCFQRIRAAGDSWSWFTHYRAGCRMSDDAHESDS